MTNLAHLIHKMRTEWKRGRNVNGGQRCEEVRSLEASEIFREAERCGIPAISLKKKISIRIFKQRPTTTYRRFSFRLK
jgi:hypothetical protein